MVHLRFASELKFVNLASRDIVAKIVDGSKDFVAVKARETFGECTSMSCLEASGAMHTFIVAYLEHPSRLEIDTQSAQSLPSFSPSNADGGPSAPRFAVESKRRTKRGLQYEKAVFPKQSYGLGM